MSDKQGNMRTCGECNAVDIEGAINHYYHCSQWDGIKGKSVLVSSAHAAPKIDITEKPSYPPRLTGWQYQYERAERLRELLSRANMALLCYTQSHGTPHTQLMDEMAEALGLDADGNTLKELGDET